MILVLAVRVGVAEKPKGLRPQNANKKLVDMEELLGNMLSQNKVLKLIDL